MIVKFECVGRQCCRLWLRFCFIFDLVGRWHDDDDDDDVEVN